MAFDQRFMEELLARNDIVDLVSSYVNLTNRGGSYWGCCPFHNEKTPSFHVRPDQQLKSELEGKVPVYLVGDAVKSGTIANAVHSAYDTVVSL